MQLQIVDLLRSQKLTLCLPLLNIFIVVGAVFVQSSGIFSEKKCLYVAFRNSFDNNLFVSAQLEKSKILSHTDKFVFF